MLWTVHCTFFLQIAVVRWALDQLSRSTDGSRFQGERPGSRHLRVTQHGTVLLWFGCTPNFLEEVDHVERKEFAALPATVFRSAALLLLSAAVLAQTTSARAALSPR